jgi:hypothetical protein
MEQDVDAAVEIATDRTREAEEGLVGKLAETPHVEGEARKVEQRAEELHVLAVDAALEDNPLEETVEDDAPGNSP